MIVVAALVGLLLWAFVLHLSLRLHRIPSVFTQTFGAFARTIAPVAPFAAFVALPGIQRAQRIRTFDAHYLAREAWAAASTLPDGALMTVIAVLHPFVVVAGIAALTAFTAAVARRYGAEELHAARAVAVGTVVGVAVVMGVIGAAAAVIYSLR